MAVAARREVVRQLQGLGLSERQALKLMGMSPSTLRYRPCGDGNAGLRERLKELAGQHRRHGYRMLHDRLTRQGWAINIKRTYRIYREEGLMVRKRRRKKLPVPERQPLVRPQRPDEVWSMDFVFDELASGRRVKTLTVVDDGCTVGRHRSISMLKSSFPVDTIWRAVLQQDDPAMAAIDLKEGPAFPVVERVADQVEVRRLDPAAWGFAEALFGGDCLATALGKAPGIDSPALIASLLMAGRCIAFHVAPLGVPR